MPPRRARSAAGAPSAESRADRWLSDRRKLQRDIVRRLPAAIRVLRKTFLNEAIELVREPPA